MPTIVTKTIGTGGDYSTLQAWEDAAPANLVTADQVWKGVINSATFNQTPSAQFTVSGSTTDATRYKWLTVAPGCSFVDNIGANPLRLDTGYGATITAPVIAYTDPFYWVEDFFHLDRVQIITHRVSTLGRALVSNCIVKSSGGGFVMGDFSSLTNALLTTTSTTNSLLQLGNSVAVTNCTLGVPSDVTTSAQMLTRPSYTSGQVVKNCAIFAAGQAALNTNFTYVNCFTDRASPPTGCTTVAYDTSTGSGFTGTTAAAADWRIKSTSALKDAGTATGAPATDIIGTTRPQGASYDVGAWEYVSAGGTNATASGGTGTGTGSGSGGTATGGSGSAGSAAGGTGTGAGSGSGGAATGTGTGTFTSDAMENNTGAGLLASTAVVWTWYQGAIGAVPTSTTHGTGTTNASGVLTVSGLPTGAGFLLVRTTDSAGVYYQPGTVS